MKLKIKLVFIHHFWRRLLTRIILLAGHTRDRTPGRFYYRKFTGFWAEFGYGKHRSFGLAMGILARLRLAKIRTMARPNSPDMPPKRTKKVRLGIIIRRYHARLGAIMVKYSHNVNSHK